MRTAPTPWNCISGRARVRDRALVARWATYCLRFYPEGNTDIYVIRASGGKPIRLTTDSADDVAPSWSRDGKWVYFTSNEPVDGRLEGIGRRRKAIQVTRNGGGTAFESPDGKSIYYTKGTIQELFGRCR